MCLCFCVCGCMCVCVYVYCLCSVDLISWMAYHVSLMQDFRPSFLYLHAPTCFVCMHLYVYVYVFALVNEYEYVHVNVHTYTYINIYIYMYNYLLIFWKEYHVIQMQSFLSFPLSVSARFYSIYIYIYIYMHNYMHLHMYMYLIFTHEMATFIHLWLIFILIVFKFFSIFNKIV